ncbi:MAG: sulfatase-like hydrolase/transferase [Acidobacteria bacterium]|nr:sulfatase-like hydrolase/transferase [Acidobacteriota bacterium]
MKQMISYYLLFIGIFSLGRLVLFALYYDRIVDAGVEHWWSFLIGLRMDTITVCVILVIPTILVLLIPKIFAQPFARILRSYFLIFLLVAIFIEVATVPFMAEFDVRPNEIFINYLEYPKEVLGNIWASYKPELLVAFLLMAVAGWLYWRLSRVTFVAVFEIIWWKRALLLIPMGLLLFAGVRSSFGHRAANISTAVYTTSHLVNEISKNSLHSITYAFYSRRRHGGSFTAYGKMDLDQAYDRVSRRLRIPIGDPEKPFSRTQLSHFKHESPKNLVIFVQESLGAQFVEAVGGQPGITPNLNRLAGQGIVFTNLFSNGTRSIRGLAGLTAGNLAVPGRGVLKRNKAQQDFFTVASLLKPVGYESSFIYGGASNFDNMRSWFLGNGFDRVIEEKDFSDEGFHGIWGVSDEDLVEKAIQEFKVHHENGQPFVSVLFSTTNHTPFEYPEGRIEQISSFPENSVENAIKFADYAIEKLIGDAQREGFFDTTIFVIVADHNVRVFGDDLVPVKMFHIPALILGGGVEPERVDALTTQPDVLATALDLMGLDLTYPIMGKSVFEDREKELALMKFHDIYALRHRDEVAIIQPGVGSLTFAYVDGHLEQRQSNVELEKDALAFVVVLDDLYQNKRYRQN